MKSMQSTAGPVVPTGSTGPVEPTGPVKPTGSTELTGPTGPVEPTGSAEPTEPTGSTEPIESYLSLAYAYDGTLEGLFTAIFRAYEKHEEPTDFVTTKDLQPRLGQYVCEIETEHELSKRVAEGIVRVAGNDAYNLVKIVGLSCTPNCGTLVYRFVRYAMKTGHAWEKDVMHPCVEPMLAIKRAMATEKERLIQFMRFEELEGDLWFAKCNPKANMIPFVMDFFSARFNTQRFIIYDEVHHIAGVHEGRGMKSWYLVPTEGTGFPKNLPTRTNNEQLMRRAWKTFYDSIAVESRYNPELRVHWMPKRFWKNLTEMQEW